MIVGLIGLGRMGEGMSRRMMKAGIEVWGYRRNYEKANEAYEKGYVDGITTDIENLVKVVKQNKQGKYQCLKQLNPVKVYRDANKDATYDETKIRCILRRCLQNCRNYG